MTLQTVDILFLTLAVGFAVLVFYLVVLIKRVHQTLDKVDILLDQFKNTTEGIEDLKNKAKGTFFSIASMALGLLFKKRR